MLDIAPQIVYYLPWAEKPHARAVCVGWRKRLDEICDARYWEVENLCPKYILRASLPALKWLEAHTKFITDTVKYHNEQIGLDVLQWVCEHTDGSPRLRGRALELLRPDIIIHKWGSTDFHMSNVDISGLTKDQVLSGIKKIVEIYPTNYFCVAARLLMICPEEWIQDICNICRESVIGQSAMARPAVAKIMMTGPLRDSLKNYLERIQYWSAQTIPSEDHLIDLIELIYGPGGKNFNPHDQYHHRFMREIVTNLPDTFSPIDKFWQMMSHHITHIAYSCGRTPALCFLKKLKCYPVENITISTAAMLEYLEWPKKAIIDGLLIKEMLNHPQCAELEKRIICGNYTIKQDHSWWMIDPSIFIQIIDKMPNFFAICDADVRMFAFYVIPPIRLSEYWSKFGANMDLQIRNGGRIGHYKWICEHYPTIRQKVLEFLRQGETYATYWAMHTK